MTMSRTISALLVAALLTSADAFAKLEVTITEGNAAAVPIAVVPFAAEALLDAPLSPVISADLARSGLFRPLPVADMLERPSSPAEVEFRNWRALGAEHLVIGRVWQDAAGALLLRLHLLDVYRGTQTDAWDLPIPPGTALRAVAHQAADLVFERLTGVPGIFSTQIAYIAEFSDQGQRRYELIIADADGENPRTIASSREPLMSPAWSPDRRRIAYVSFENGRSVIFVQDIASGALTRVVSERGINGAPSFSPDGRKLAVTLSFERNADIYVIDLDTGQRRRLTDHWAIDTEPDWSPDGQRIVFTSDRGGKPQIYSVPAGGGEPVRISFEGDQNLRARFSPDGSRLVLVNHSQSGYRIGLLDLASGEMRILSDGPLDESPSFAPNGAVVIYSAAGPQGAELRTVSIDGRVRQRLRQVGDIREPAWSPFARPAPRR